MTLLLVNDNGQTMVRLENVEQFDGTRPGHVTGFLDLLDAMIATARSSGGREEITRTA